MIVLIREPAFERRHNGVFRGWLRQVTVNPIRRHRKPSQQPLLVGGGDAIDCARAQLEDSVSGLSRQRDQEHNRHVLRQILNVVRADFESRTWPAFT